nr:anhydro-N-acetylmuramic acid kinase [Paenibacillus larvae]
MREPGRPGEVEETLLENMLGHPYFAEQPVKTTGRELFGQEYTRFWLQKRRLWECSRLIRWLPLRH